MTEHAPGRGETGEFPLPSPRQLEWQSMELTMFAHFGVNTFTDREWGDGREDPSIFNPARFDARQWADVARDSGFRMIVLTAKHHDGFCLWPSAFTSHTVRGSPWRGGRGDVVRELSDACARAGLRFGIYLSPWDRNCPHYGDSDRYNAFYLAQLRELLTQYGPVAEVWFDGACGEGPNGKRQQYDWLAYQALVRELQPDAVMFSDAGPDVRWIGNERGFAGDPCWSKVDSRVVRFPGDSARPEQITALQHGSPSGDVWRPGECDVSIRPGWFWHARENASLKSADELFEIYLASVGRNAQLLLNVPPNRDGLIDDVDVARLREFRLARERAFAGDLAASPGATSSRGSDGVHEIALARATELGFVALGEDISRGQHVARFRIDICRPGHGKGSEPWETIHEGTTIGRRRIVRLRERAPVQRVRLVIEQSLGSPHIEHYALH